MAESIFSPQYKSLSSYGPQSNVPEFGYQAPGNTGPGIAGGASPYSFNFGQNGQTTPSGGVNPDIDFEEDKGFSFGDWAKLGTGALQAYTGYKGLGLAEDQFGFAKDSFNVNLANQAKLINTELEARQRARLETGGQYGRDESGQAALQSDLQAYLKPRQVSGAPI